MKASEVIVNTKSDEKNRVLILGILTFTIGTFTLDTFLSSLNIEAIFLSVTTIIFLAFYLSQNKGLIIFKLELMWLVFFMYFLFNILYQSNFSKVFVIDIIVFFILFIFLLLMKLEINYYKIAMNTILIISIVYALSSIFQYLNMDLYTSLVLPRFTIQEQEEILRIFRHGNYTGFTWQTAYISGYLIYGIAALLLLFKENTNKLSRILSIIALPLLFIGLVLGGKRAHLLFMILALLITYLFSTEFKMFFIQILKIMMGTITFIIGGIALFTVYNPGIDTPIGKLLNNLNRTIEGFASGEDISSGRTILYDYALKLFNDSPILGIGWREFSQLSVGLLNNERGSHPHNIYFQLLTELGLVGFVLFMIPIIYILIKTIKLLINAEVLFSFDLRWRTGLQFSLFSQVFFLLYGMTGNLLTDHMYILMWGFASSITLSSMKYANRGMDLKN